MADDPDLEWLMIDATIVRAQAQAAEARRKRGDLKPRLSAARVAGSAPSYAVVDALGLPVRFAIGPGQQNDMAPACDLIGGLSAMQVIATGL